MNLNEYKYSYITSKIIGCAIKVYNNLGNGFQEVIYQRALAVELMDAGVIFVREAEIPIIYNGNEIGLRRVDFFVEDKILVEFKAVTKIEGVHIAQAINYIEAFDKQIGLLINFGFTSLEFRRLINKKNYLPQLSNDYKINQLKIVTTYSVNQR